MEGIGDSSLHQLAEWRLVGPSGSRPRPRPLVQLLEPHAVRPLRMLQCGGVRAARTPRAGRERAGGGGRVDASTERGRIPPRVR